MYLCGITKWNSLVSRHNILEMFIAFLFLCTNKVSSSRFICVANSYSVSPWAFGLWVGEQVFVMYSTCVCNFVFWISSIKIWTLNVRLHCLFCLLREVMPAKAVAVKQVVFSFLVPRSLTCCDVIRDFWVCLLRCHCFFSGWFDKYWRVVRLELMFFFNARQYMGRYANRTVAEWDAFIFSDERWIELRALLKFSSTHDSVWYLFLDVINLVVDGPNTEI